MLLKPLPCPFCGELPTIMPAKPEFEGNAWGSVVCENHKCPARPKVMDGVTVVDSRGSEAYKNSAIRRWNIRIEE